MEKEYQLIVKNCKKFGIYKKIVDELKINQLNSEISEEKQIPFLLAIASIESKCNPKKKNSNTGAAGLMQLMPVARKEIEMSSANAFDANTSIKMTIKYINWTISNYLNNSNFAIKNGKTIWESAQSNDEKLAWILLAFNKGPGNARKAFKNGSNPIEYGKKYHTGFSLFYNFWNDTDHLKAIGAIIKIDEPSETEKIENNLENIVDSKNFFLTNKGSLISENTLRNMILRYLI